MSLVSDWLLPPKIYNSYLNILKGKRESKYTDQQKKQLEETLSLANRHAGERCFIVATGSSIKNQDLTKLKGETVITVSNAFVHPAFAESKPKYHVVSPIVKYHDNNMPEENFASWLKDMEENTAGVEMFFQLEDSPLLTKYDLFSNRKIHWVSYADTWDGNCDNIIDLSRIPPIWSVSEAAITIALYLGFEKIYLLGFDHDWFNGLRNYFYDHKVSQKGGLPEDHKPLAVDSEYQMRRHAEIFKKYKCFYSLKNNIYNANSDKNSYVDVFPKVDFNNLFDEPTTKA